MDLETRKFVDKYLFCIIHNEHVICGRMADWGGLEILNGPP